MNSSFTVSKKDKITWLLKSLKDHNELVSLAVSGTQVGGKSIVLDVKAKEDTFAIDPIPSPEGSAMIKSGKTFNLRGSLSGVEVVCDQLKLNGIGEDEDGDFFIVDIPDKIRYIQRRDAYRAQVRGLMDVAVDLQDDVAVEWIKEEQQVVKLADISAAGCRITFEQVAAADLADEGQIWTMKLCIPDQQPIAVKVETRFNRFLARSKVCDVGCRFVDTDHETQRLIDHYVTEMQRLRHQKLGR